ncbi:MAG: hypothetical protein NTW87_11950 [Planctomycetota bacterium]|nr:hypothetical protein [Planctomycetota bacterium]
MEAENEPKRALDDDQQKLERLRDEFVQCKSNLLNNAKIDIKTAIRMAAIVDEVEGCKPEGGIKAWVENHGGYSYGHVCSYRRLAEALKSEKFSLPDGIMLSEACTLAAKFLRDLKGKPTKAKATKPKLVNAVVTIATVTEFIRNADASSAMVIYAAAHARLEEISESETGLKPEDDHQGEVVVGTSEPSADAVAAA